MKIPTKGATKFMDGERILVPGGWLEVDPAYGTFAMFAGSPDDRINAKYLGVLGAGALREATRTVAEAARDPVTGALPYSDPAAPRRFTIPAKGQPHGVRVAKFALRSTRNTPDVEEEVEAMARAMGIYEGEAVYEHGQWWISVPTTGALYSVVDTSRGLDVEKISEGDFYRAPGKPAKFSVWSDALEKALVAMDRAAIASLVSGTDDSVGAALIDLFQRKVAAGMAPPTAASLAVLEWLDAPPGVLPGAAYREAPPTKYAASTLRSPAMRREERALAKKFAEGGAKKFAKDGFTPLNIGDRVLVSGAMGTIVSYRPGSIWPYSVRLDDPSAMRPLSRSGTPSPAMSDDGVVAVTGSEIDVALPYREAGAKAPAKFALTPGAMFVVVDVGPPGGRLANETIFTSSAAADAEADRLRAGGMNVQVIDALWYEPARARLVASGVIGR